MTTDSQAETPVGGVGEESSDMGALLEGSLDYKSAERGEIVEGTVMSLEREGVLVDVGSKSEGIIPRNEMHSLGPNASLEPGEKVLVFVMQSETGEGQILLSIDKARGERGWRTLQDRFESGESFEGQVTGYNRGGLLVNVEGVNAFVPLSQLVGLRPERGENNGGNSLADAVGRTLRLKVIEINRRRNRVILSERAALQEWRMIQKERLIQELREGDIRRGRISSVRNFGVFVDLGGADGLAHLSELSWERDKSPMELFKVGDEVDVFVTKVDPENKKIALSLRLANPGRWDEVVSKYQEGQVVPGLVTKVVTFGAFARIEGPVEGLIHVSELVDRRIGHPKEVVREGDLLPLKIVRIERDRHRLGLSLRRGREDGETMGFVFTDGGEVLSVPDDIRKEFEEREGPISQLTRTFEEEQPAAAVSERPPTAVEQAAPEAAAPILEAPAAEVAPAVEVREEPASAMQEAFAQAGALATEERSAETDAAPEAVAGAEVEADAATDEAAAPAVAEATADYEEPA
ncbi:MAG: S1 RNA-binding domain-containing protein, partial [Dehalococcoidia bacterium]